LNHLDVPKKQTLKKKKTQDKNGNRSQSESERESDHDFSPKMEDKPDSNRGIHLEVPKEKEKNGHHSHSKSEKENAHHDQRPKHHTGKEELKTKEEAESLKEEKSKVEKSKEAEDRVMEKVIDEELTRISSSLSDDHKDLQHIFGNSDLLKDLVQLTKCQAMKKQRASADCGDSIERKPPPIKPKPIELLKKTNDASPRTMASGLKIDFELVPYMEQTQKERDLKSQRANQTADDDVERLKKEIAERKIRREKERIQDMLDAEERRRKLDAIKNMKLEKKY